MSHVYRFHGVKEKDAGNLSRYKSLNREKRVMKLNEFKNFFFDLDRTIWNWDETVTGAEDMLETLRGAGKNVYFHTDNTLLSRKAYAEKLNRMGIQAEEEEIITSGYVASQVLLDKNCVECSVIGESGLMEEIESVGIDISKEAENTVIGFDRSFNYEKLSRLMDKIEGPGTVYTCSEEKIFERENSEQPHQRSINQAARVFGDVKNVGKPSESYRKHFKNYFSYFPGDSMFIGDRFADMETGNQLGMKTAAVMTGEITEERLKDATEHQVPDYVLTSLDKLRRRII
jgi:HAD superfamily hydrolase (TIGR01450 family)